MRRFTLFLFGLLLAGCTSTAVGTGIKVGEINKTGVETAMAEVIRLDCAGHSQAGAVPGCTKRIDEATYQRAAAAYGKYEVAQRAYADSLIAWTRVKSAPNDQRLQVATDQLTAQTKSAAAILCSFKSASPNLTALCGGMGE
jgi:hypothetical protein